MHYIFSWLLVLQRNKNIVCLLDVAKSEKDLIHTDLMDKTYTILFCVHNIFKKLYALHSILIVLYWMHNYARTVRLTFRLTLAGFSSRSEITGAIKNKLHMLKFHSHIFFYV